MNRTEIQDAYIERILDGMSMKELMIFAAQKLEQEFDQLSDEVFLEDVRNFYPHLLEEA